MHEHRRIFNTGRFFVLCDKNEDFWGIEVRIGMDCVGIDGFFLCVQLGYWQFMTGFFFEG